MHKLLLVCALVACGSSTGCSMMLNGARTLVYEPLRYCAPKDTFFATIRNRKFAEQAWKDVVANSPAQDFSEHYEDGFKDGYCDYLFLGGPGNPPAVPPRKYWRRYYETPEGHLAIGQWYSGFAHGASMAQASGFREFITVPSSLGPVPGPPVLLPGSAPMPLPPAAGPSGVPPIEEVPLPASVSMPTGHNQITARAGSPVALPPGILLQPSGTPAAILPHQPAVASDLQAMPVSYQAPGPPALRPPVGSQAATGPLPSSPNPSVQIQPLPATVAPQPGQPGPTASSPAISNNRDMPVLSALPDAVRPSDTASGYLGPWSGHGGQRLLRASHHQPAVTGGHAP